METPETTSLITIHQPNSYSHMSAHYDPSHCSILGFYPKIDAPETTSLITIHQMHSYSHMGIHYDSSRYSMREGVSRAYDRMDARETPN